MPYTHVFSVHSSLQEQLAVALVRDRGIDPAAVLFLCTRGSFRSAEDYPFTAVDGDLYRTNGGYNLAKHRRRNLIANARFTIEVLDELAPEFQVYAPMYTYWYLRLLRERAAAYHVVEDGFGS